MDRLDRRRSYRVPLTNAWAECCSIFAAGIYQVRNLSRGGVLLQGHSHFPADTELRMLMHLPGRTPLSLDGIVSRSDTRKLTSSELAVKFGYLSDDEQDAIADVVAQKVVHELSPGVLICTSKQWEGQALARSVRYLGYNPFPVSTPLCAIRKLASDSQNIEAVILGMNVGKTGALDVAQFLTEYRPNLKRILVGRPSWRTMQAATGVMDAVVRKPWTAMGLKKALAAPRKAV